MNGRERRERKKTERRVRSRRIMKLEMEF